MSLKVRLIALVAGALLISLAATLLLIGLSASKWVQTEIDTDARMARQLVQARIAEEAEESESPNRIADLLHALETTHDLHAQFVSNAAATAAPEATDDDDDLPATTRSAPSWLGPLLGVRPTVQKLPVTRDGGTQGWIIITTDPGTGIARVWRMIEIGLAAITLFSILTLALVAFGLSQGLRPLGRLASGLTRIGAGDYTSRVGNEGPTEIALLGRHFDLMADQLQSMQTRTRALTAQLLAVQERERRDIARDLHDDLGPCLLAANLDVVALARLNQAQAQTPARDGVEECARGLRDALSRMQGQVRAMISRLHLESGDAFDLGAATADLAGFWRERCPEITWHVAPWDRWPELPPARAVPLQRILQEAVSNAVRHGSAKNIYIDCTQQAGATVVQVRDDGIGIPEQIPAGFGIPGMRDRMEALGGSLTIDSQGRGTTVVARLPAADAAHMDINTLDDAVPDRAVA
jgi:two-component system, NarL family, sensor histidine kinase UhpB